MSYTVQGYVFDWRSSSEFYYILETGAAWKDTIGSADIAVRFPYPATSLNFSAHPEGWVATTPREIKWHFEDFEPDFNIDVRMVKPSIWQSVLIETDNTSRNPQDGEAWGRLGKAYEQAIVGDTGKVWDGSTTEGQEIYKLSAAAYEKAVTLLPNDADLHYGYADLLCIKASYSLWNSWGDRTNPDWNAFMGCVRQLKATLDIDPTHEAANKLAGQMADQFGGFNLLINSGVGWDYLILTPGPSWTPLPTLTASPTWDNSTSTPTLTAPTLTATPITPSWTPGPTDTPWSSWTPTRRVTKTMTPIAFQTTTPEEATITPASTVQARAGDQSSSLLIGVGTAAGLAALWVGYKRLSNKK